MKLSYRSILGLTGVLVIALFFSSDMATQKAQAPCETFDAIGQMLIPTAQPLAAGHRWGGEVYIKMGDEYLRGLISGDDGTVVRMPNTGHGKTDYT